MSSASSVAPRPSSRIPAIDIARGVAMLGMITQHVVIGISREPSELTVWMLHAPAGRASVLFFMLSGVALSLVAQRGSSSASTPALLKRGALLLVGGLYIALTFWSGSILHTYGAMFLIAPLLLRRRSKTLLIAAAAAFTVGPLLLATVPEAIGGWLTQATGVHGWLVTTLTTVLFRTYALVVWIGFFMVGMVLGRLRLQRTKVAAWMLVGGVAFLVPATMLIDALNRRLDAGLSTTADACAGIEIGSDGMPIGDIPAACQTMGTGNHTPFSWSSFTDLNAHSNTTAWALQSLAIAIAITGLALLLPAAMRRVLRPIEAIGTLSLSCYLLHMFLVQDVWKWLGAEREGVSTWYQFGVLLVIMTIMATFATLILRRWKRGPFEWLLAQFTGGGIVSASAGASVPSGSGAVSGHIGGHLGRLGDTHLGVDLQGQRGVQVGSLDVLPQHLLGGAQTDTGIAGHSPRVAERFVDQCTVSNDGRDQSVIQGLVGADLAARQDQVEGAGVPDQAGQGVGDAHLASR